MTGSRMDRYDFLSSIVLVVFAIGVIVESLRMERLEQLNINPYTAPGLIPGLIGVLLLICGIALGVRAALRGGWRFSLGRGAIESVFGNDTVRRVGLTLALTLGFALGLFGRLPFSVAGAIFIFAFIILLGGPLTERGPAAVRRFAIATVIALVAAFTIGTVFTEVFYVKLP